MGGLDALKARLSDVPGIETLTLARVGGRDCYGFDGLIAGVDPSSSEDQVVDAIRKASRLRQSNVTSSDATLPPQPIPPMIPLKDGFMSTPAPGGFAASLRAMMDDARAGVAKARADGLAQVKDAVGKLDEAKAATAHVAGQMAKTIQAEADAVMAELGQISNNLTGDGD